MVRSTSPAKDERELELELDIAEFLAEKPRPRPRRVRRNLPHYDKRKGMWRGGDTRTLYAFTGHRTGQTVVYPGGPAINMGPEVTVRVASREEAERLWQNPLHVGWTVA
jgi:hypothetical protein